MNSATDGVIPKSERQHQNCPVNWENSQAKRNVGAWAASVP